MPESSREKHRFYSSVVAVFMQSVEKTVCLSAINIYPHEAKSPSGRVGEEPSPKLPVAHEVKPGECRVNVALLIQITESIPRNLL